MKFADCIVRAVYPWDIALTISARVPLYAVLTAARH